MKKTLLTFVAFFAMMTMALAQSFSWTSAEWSGVAEKAQTISYTKDGFTFTADKAAGQTPPTVNASANDLRVYANGTLNITAEANFQKIVFNLSNKKRLAEIAVDNGQVAVDKEAWTLTWTGDAKTVTFTVGEKNVYGTDPTTKAGQFCVASIVVGEGGGEVKPEPQPEEKAIFAETFEAGQGAFTINDVTLPEGSTYVWKHSERDGVKYMQGSAYVGSPKASESWLVSPVIDLAGAKDAVLSFENLTNYFKGSFATTCAVKVKVDAGEWTNLKVENLPATDSWEFVNSTASLKSFLGKKVQIAFVYTSTTEAAGTWRIKNFKVTEGGAVTPDPEPQPEPEAPVYTSISELKKNAKNPGFKASFEFKDLTVIAKAKNDIYVSDGKEATLFFGTENSLNVGDKISGKVSGELVSFFGLTEFKNLDYTAVNVTSKGNAVAPIVVTLEELAAEGSFAKLESQLVIVKGVKVGAEVFAKQNVDMVDGAAKVTLRDNYKSAPADFKFDTNASYDITGVIGQYKGKAQINLLSMEGIQISTGIEAVEAENGAQVIYDLSGRRVAKAVKGLYIINGKKVYVK